VPLLEIPQPYDFEVSTERFRAFGPDLANLWHEGGLHRVVGRREVRIEAAPGGVVVEPLDPASARAEPVREPRHLDQRATGLALRGVRDPEPDDRALRRAR
jgi:hypothetical protein